jgi:hypothetical protein
MITAVIRPSSATNDISPRRSHAAPPREFRYGAIDAFGLLSAFSIFHILFVRLIPRRCFVGQEKLRKTRLTERLSVDFNYEAESVIQKGAQRIAEICAQVQSESFEFSLALDIQVFVES